jgi:acylglycerol lipase
MAPFLVEQPRVTRSRIAVTFLALALAASGCTDGLDTRPAPLPGDAAIAPGHVQTAAGDRLALTNWPPRTPPRAVILALHGFGDSGEQTFAGAAEYWAERGILTYAPDQRGFGANASFKRWPGPDALIADAIAVSRAVRATHPGVPIVVVGESMGGGVALAAAQHGLEADALVLSGPAIAGGVAVSPVLRAGGWALANTLPDRRWTGGGVVSIRPTDNLDALIDASRNPYAYGSASSRELYGLLRLMDRAAAAAPHVRTPTLTLIGANDGITRPDGIRAVATRIPGLVQIVEYPEGWHWLFRDLQAERVWADVAAFVLSAAR